MQKQYDLSHLIVTACAALFAGALIGHVLTGQGGGQTSVQAVAPLAASAPGTTASAAPAASPEIEAAVMRVAANFYCPCGSCGVDRLDVCDCDMPKGSVEVKGVIREALLAGKTENEVIALVDARYGHRLEATSPLRSGQ